ncbi:conserved hypothetical protein [Luminiphilus syltensis NOR5-1B]|uniref:CopG family transcriptional regulator n=1 Tax=Luminiphilus syltensis NOR5-1B TaxID=565045 RepID=B8KUY7_9GAMM|nr:hypothetical protein [Luminiphilus syltensis]EED35545.1 conserved hypothetical protein [Luminiphilus syltensis NOR5-1B]
MGQVTIYLDDETEQRMADTASIQNLSKSKWVAGVIREKLQADWPKSVREAAGSWTDFPPLDSLRSGGVDDAAREDL